MSWWEIARYVGRGRPVAYCRLVETRSVPQKAARRCSCLSTEQAGTLGDASRPSKAAGLGYFERQRCRGGAISADDNYGWDDGLICGGRMQILIERHAIVRRLATLWPLTSCCSVVAALPKRLCSMESGAICRPRGGAVRRGGSRVAGLHDERLDVQEWRSCAAR